MKTNDLSRLIDYVVTHAEKNGTVGVLRQVAPHLDEAELQAVLKAVRGVRIKTNGKSRG